MKLNVTKSVDVEKRQINFLVTKDEEALLNAIKRAKGTKKTTLIVRYLLAKEALELGLTLPDSMKRDFVE